MIQLRWLAPEPADEAVLLALLDAPERARVARLHHAADRLAHAAAHALLRSLLSEVAGGAPQAWRFEAEASGKPRLATCGGPDLRFSLSHARGMVACAVAEALEVGVDVEPLAAVPDALALARASLAPGEVDGLEALTEPARSRAFVRLWTLKEAAAKVSGAGLGGGLTGPALDLKDMASGPGAPLPLDAGDLAFRQFELPGPFALALAFPSGGGWAVVECRQARVQEAGPIAAA